MTLTNGKADLGDARPASDRGGHSVDLSIAERLGSYHGIEDRLELYQRVHRKLQRDQPGERITAVVGMMRRDLERMHREAAQ